MRLYLAKINLVQNQLAEACQHSVYKPKTCQKIEREHLNFFIKSVSKRVQP